MIPLLFSCADSGRSGFWRILLIVLASVFKPLSAILVLVWAWRSHTSWREIGYITGLVFGTIFAITGRIWMVMCMHAAFDLAAVAITYWDLEVAVAHLVYK